MRRGCVLLMVLTSLVVFALVGCKSKMPIGIAPNSKASGMKIDDIEVKPLNSPAQVEQNVQDTC